MDTNRLRESSDEQDDQDDPDQENVTNSAVNDVKGTEDRFIEDRRESRSSLSRRSSKQKRNNSRSETPQNHSRTSNQLNSTKRSWRSANAFINFVQDFKRDYPDMTIGRNIFQICGERWKAMSNDQKQPYIAAANSVKRLKQRKVVDNCEQQIKKSVTRVSKRKADTKRKETSQKLSKAIIRVPKSNSDTDTATTTVHSSMSDADSL
ncbi:PREDICTED: non-histone chromosomal protein 6-like [Ceratosolen solmsi marchali]|uniref:Non-histone chromosomal protein 6-like n=1 Tax=Ceratosolen solmsi marchali TaxID=326594 RepID=A0AAJ7E0P1_9HYME|nr:PREDICTED: non-histone chromosomal protein 6-like [Ceratosolen solmsi marchali]